MEAGRNRAIANLAIGILGVGFAPILVRISGVDPTASAFWRFALAIPVLMVLGATLPAEKRLRAPKKSDYILLFLSAFLFGIALTVWHWSVHYTSVVNATLLANLAPIFVTALAWAFGATISSRFLTGLAIAVLGTLVLSGPKIGAGNELSGNLLGLLTAALYGSYLYVAKRLRETFSAITIMTWDCVVSASLILLLSAFSDTSLMPSGSSSWLKLAALAIVSQVIGRTAIVQSLRVLPVTYSSANLLLHPVVSAILAFAILDESVGGYQVLGGVLVALGLIHAQWPQIPAVQSPSKRGQSRRPRRQKLITNINNKSRLKRAG